MPEERDPEELVAWRLDDGVGRITIDRADKKNALTAAMRDRVIDLVARAGGDLRVRVVVLSGAGGDFCAGADVGGGSRHDAPPRPEDAPDRTMGDVARMIQRGWQRLIAEIQDCPKPVLAAVEGVAAGGGMHLAVACDLVVAADDARFISAFVRRGILPDAGGAYLLTRLIGPQRAKQLMFFGEELSGREAADIGLVARAAPAGEVEEAVADWAKRLAAAPTQAIGATKRLVNRALDGDRETAFLEEAYLQELVQGTDDAREGMLSFVERRDPEFRGW